MATSTYRFNLEVGTGQTAIRLSDGVIKYFMYRCMWDRGNVAHFLIFDPSLDFHNLLSEMKVDDPTPRLTFRPVRVLGGAEVAGSQRIMYALKFGLITLNDGLYVKIIAVDLAGIQLRKQTDFAQNGVKAGSFCNALAQTQEITSEIPETGDPEESHRAVQAEAIAHIRYELDRTLSSNARPISLQFDDRLAQKLRGYEMPYTEDGFKTDVLLNTFAPLAVYNYGPNNSDNESTGSTFGSAIYDFQSVQSYGPAIWGHQVSIDQLGVENQHVVGKLKNALAKNLGIGGKIFDKSHRRLHMPREPVGGAVSDKFRIEAIMKNALFQAEMSSTYGSILIDTDFAAYDDPAILNTNHIKIAITAGSGNSSGRALIPREAVVMGWSHFVGHKGQGFSRIFFRRGK